MINPVYNTSKEDFDYRRMKEMSFFLYNKLLEFAEKHRKLEYDDLYEEALLEAVTLFFLWMMITKENTNMDIVHHVTSLVRSNEMFVLREIYRNKQHAHERSEQFEEDRLAAKRQRRLDKLNSAASHMNP